MLAAGSGRQGQLLMVADQCYLPRASRCATNAAPTQDYEHMVRLAGSGRISVTGVEAKRARGSAAWPKPTSGPADR